MNNEEVRRAAANIHEELTDVYGLLEELEHLRGVRDSVASLSHANTVNQQDLDGLNQEIADLERRERLYQAMFDKGCERSSRFSSESLHRILKHSVPRIGQRSKPNSRMECEL